MSKKYTQLCLKQRYKIEVLINAVHTQKYIASQIGVSPSTINRELRRNIAKRGRTSGSYLGNNAQRKTQFRHQNKFKHITFTDQMKAYAFFQMKEERWSPEYISAIGNINGLCTVSAEWIYQWIWRSKHSNCQIDKPYKKAYQYLKHGKRRRKRGNFKDSRGIIHYRTSIENRPAIVSKRKRIGDIEVDLMMGKDHKAGLLVMTDRTTLHTNIRKLDNKQADNISAIIIDCLKHNKYKAKTLTFDNDLAFAKHYIVAKKLKLKTYFTRPYTSQGKGTVENRIGVIRRFFPKKTNLTFVSEKEIKDVQNKINNRPVRKFNYKSPNQVLLEKIALIT